MRAATLQDLHDLRINPWAVQLVVESYKNAGPGALPFEFEFEGVEISLRLSEPTQGENMSRFDYVKYDGPAIESQAAAKAAVTRVEALIEEIKSPEAKKNAMDALEVAYMWIGKGIRNDQIQRNGTAELEEGRGNS